jgi:hypothetical protein
MTFIQVELFIVRERTWQFTKISPSFLFSRNRDDIYSRGALPQQENELDCLWKTSGWFYWQRIMLIFIEEELFHIMSKNLTVYEKLMSDFIVTKSWWHLLNGNSSTIREGTPQLTKSADRFEDHRVLMKFIERGFQKKKTDMTLIETLMVDFISKDYHAIYWKKFFRDKDLNRLRNAPDRFYCHGVVMELFETNHFQDKRRTLIVYKKFLINFIGTESW